jgi:hypothetical protein
VRRSMTDGEERRPREKGNSRRGLAFPGASLGGVGGTPLTIISAAVFRSNQAKGAQDCAPFPFLSVPTRSKGEISNGDNKIAAWLGRGSSNSTHANGRRKTEKYSLSRTPCCLYASQNKIRRRRPANA